jgi:hypothetical protein
LPDSLWVSDYEKQDCPHPDKICLECEFAQRLLLTGLPVDCKYGNVEKIKSLWHYMFKGYYHHKKAQREPK